VCLGGFADSSTNAVTMVACDEATAGIFRLQPNGALQLDAPAVAAVKAAAAKAAAIAAAEAARAKSDVPVADINSAEHADSVGAATDVEVGPDGQGKEAAAAVALAAAAAAETAALDAEATAEHTAAAAGNSPKLCLTVDAESVTDVAQLSGAVVTLAVCAGTDNSNSSSSSTSSNRGHQVWELDDKAAGTVVNAASGFCMTGGWPFLSSAAFVRPDGQLAVVVLNEAQEAVEFDIALEHAGTELAATIPAHSIQTYII
jgi:Glycosyl hydrolase family 30 beta sandwich domain